MKNSPDTATHADTKQFLYPPGGILIWMIILVELVTFVAGIIAMAWQRNSAIELFETSQASLNSTIGVANTMFLLTSGFFIADSIRFLKLGNNNKSYQKMIFGLFFGGAFLFLKAIEYFDKIEEGFHLTYNTFFTFYWLLTGFHFLHVLVGVIILWVISSKIKNNKYSVSNYSDPETGAAFWHMCDLIWLVLFPVLYLL